MFQFGTTCCSNWTAFEDLTWCRGYHRAMQGALVPSPLMCRKLKEAPKQLKIPWSIIIFPLPGLIKIQKTMENHHFL
jgi:hypothetical protein